MSGEQWAQRDPRSYYSPADVLVSAGWQTYEVRNRRDCLLITNSELILEIEECTSRQIASGCARYTNQLGVDGAFNVAP